MNALLVGLTLGGLAVGFTLGRTSAPTPGPGAAPPHLVQAESTLEEAPSGPSEVFPLVPGPQNGPGQGQRPGPQAPGQAPGEGECTVLMFRDGQMYRMQPGEPRPGGQPGPGMPGGDGELFPLQPFPQPDQPTVPGPEMRV